MKVTRPELAPSVAVPARHAPARGRALSAQRRRRQMSALAPKALTAGRFRIPWGVCSATAIAGRACDVDSVAETSRGASRSGFRPFQGAAGWKQAGGRSVNRARKTAHLWGVRVEGPRRVRLTLSVRLRVSRRPAGLSRRRAAPRSAGSASRCRTLLPTGSGGRTTGRGSTHARCNARQSRKPNNSKPPPATPPAAKPSAAWSFSIVLVTAVFEM